MAVLSWAFSRIGSALTAIVAEDCCGDGVTFGNDSYTGEEFLLTGDGGETETFCVVEKEKEKEKGEEKLVMEAKDCSVEAAAVTGLEVISVTIILLSDTETGDISIEVLDKTFPSFDMATDSCIAVVGRTESDKVDH